MIVILKEGERTTSIVVGYKELVDSRKPSLAPSLKRLDPELIAFEHLSKIERDANALNS
jgi:hypothetical protein